MGVEWESLIEGVKKGDIRALAKMITRVENREPGWMEAMRRIYPYTGKAHVIGITGSPGAGKSTLTNKITSDLVDRDYKVGIIAVDPSSPFSGGALLGDRLRMKDVSLLDGVFVRSMATRGALGGLNQAARDVVKIMDAFGKDFVIMETVGVGQDEVEIVKTADIVLVICVPGQGDAIQAIKAGVMEIADIYVVNKADREGADQVVSDIRAMLDLSTEENAHRPPIMKTIASTGEGVPQLVATVLDLLKKESQKKERQKLQVKEEILVILEQEVAKFLRQQFDKNGKLEKEVQEVVQGKRDPYSIVQEMITPLMRELQVSNAK